jgi:hypothetical protein
MSFIYFLLTGIEIVKRNASERELNEFERKLISMDFFRFLLPDSKSFLHSLDRFNLENLPNLPRDPFLIEESEAWQNERQRFGILLVFSLTCFLRSYA